MTIRFSVGPCDLGRLLVAWSDAGVCALWLGDDDLALVQELVRRFDDAIQAPPGVEFECAAQQVRQPWKMWDLPVDVRGTEFQKAVWAALRAVPPGTHTTYARVASALGRPRAYRAVAAACAANQLGIIVPCHRVVASSGKLSGYRWGIERKRRLLDHERARCVVRGAAGVLLEA